MTDQRRIERLIAELRAHVTELARLQRKGGKPRELQQRRRAIGRLKSQLADAVRQQLQTNPLSAHRI